MARYFLEGTFVLIALFLVLGHSADFASILNASGGVYASDVKALQGRII